MHPEGHIGVGTPKPTRETSSTVLRLLLVSALWLLASCGSALPALPPLTFTVPQQHIAPVSIDEMPWLACDDTTGLLNRYNCARQLLAEHGYVPYDPTGANSTHPSREFAWYLTTQQVVDGRTIHHIIFVVDGAWTTDRTDTFLSTFYAMPSNTPASAGVPYFHFVAAAPLPPAVQYMFSNDWWGRCESDLLLRWSERDFNHQQADTYVDEAAHAFVSYGLLFETPESTTESLEILLRRMPPPTEDSYRPIATLLAAGLLLGDLVKQEFPEFDWADGADVLATRFALRSSQRTDLFLRPIDFVLQTWRDQQAEGTPIQDYLALLRQRL